MMQMSKMNIHQLIKNSHQPQPVGELFINDLERAIKLKESENIRKVTKSYKPSSLTCLRNMYFQMTGEEPEKETMDSNLVGICETGTDRHERLQEIISQLAEYDVDFKWHDVEEYIVEKGLTHLEIISKEGHETKLFNKSLNMRFMCDGIITYRGNDYVLEIKTETIYKWQSRKGVAEEHIPQGTAYATNFDIDKVMFLYENRDFSGKKAYVLDITDEMKLELILDTINDCNQYIENKEVPPYPHNAGPKLCKYCKYIEPCIKAGR